MDDRTVEFPRAHWGPLLARLQDRVRGQPVRVERIEPSRGDQILISHASLLAIGLEKRGSSSGAVELELGRNGELNHRILRPTRIYALHDAGGRILCLDIEDPEGRTLVHFEQPLMLTMETSEGQPAGA
jgi:hypothetical protein